MGSNKEGKTLDGVKVAKAAKRLLKADVVTAAENLGLDKSRVEEALNAGVSKKELASALLHGVPKEELPREPKARGAIMMNLGRLVRDAVAKGKSKGYYVAWLRLHDRSRKDAGKRTQALIYVAGPEQTGSILLHNSLTESVDSVDFEIRDFVKKVGPHGERRHVHFDGDDGDMPLEELKATPIGLLATATHVPVEDIERSVSMQLEQKEGWIELELGEDFLFALGPDVPPDVKERLMKYNMGCVVGVENARVVANELKAEAKSA